MGAWNALEQAAGATYVYLLYLSVLDQFDVSNQVSRDLANRAECIAPRERELARLLKLMKSTERAAFFFPR